MNSKSESFLIKFTCQQQSSLTHLLDNQIMKLIPPSDHLLQKVLAIIAFSLTGANESFQGLSKHATQPISSIPPPPSLLYTHSICYYKYKCHHIVIFQVITETSPFLILSKDLVHFYINFFCKTNILKDLSVFTTDFHQQ